MKLAILDDYQEVALSFGDWENVQKEVEITTFNQHLGSAENVVDTLQSFEIICCMRERTPFPKDVLEQLPNLKLIITSGAKNASIDVKAAESLGIQFLGTQSPGHAASELAWGLLMSLARNIHLENNVIRNGGWQTTIGTDLKGQTLGVLGLGRHGANIARFGKAFGMNVIAWSQNLTPGQCEEHKVSYVDKQTFFSSADFVSVNLKMGQRNLSLIGEAELNSMKKTAYLINTSRGPIINEKALINALQSQSIAGAGLDVYDQEPIAPDHPLLSLENALLTSHIGFVTKQTYDVFYGQMAEKVLDWISKIE